MSRVAKQAIFLTPGVTCERMNEQVFCKGPNGTLSVNFPSCFELELSNNTCKVHKKNAEVSSMLWGTVVSNLKNAVRGVAKFFEQEINLVGVGYKCIKQNDAIELYLGYSNSISFVLPKDVQIELKKPNEMILRSHDKQLLGDVCSKLESLRPHEPYKGKGIIKVGKFYIRKEGKKK